MSDEDEGLAFRPSVRPLLTALVANLALAVLLIGIPYVRGRDRARESLQGAVALSACLLQGTAREMPGLALPIGERERFAALYEQAPEDWPGRCAPLLAQIDHEPVTFILPTPKAAELDLHVVSEAMGEALLDLEQARMGVGGAVPERPLAVLGQLRGTVASLLAANDLAIDPMALAIDLASPAEALPVPSRIPVRTGAGYFHVSVGREPAMRIVAADGLGIAEVEVSTPSPGSTEPAHLRLVQLRRPSGARGVVVGAEDAWLVWTTAETTCDADPRHCAMRAMGLGRLLEERRVMRPEHWLAAHPSGAPDRSVFVGADRFTVVARAAEGGLEARVFPRGEPLAEPVEDGTPPSVTPTRAIATRPLPGALDWIVDDGRVSVLERSDTGRAVRSMLVGAELLSDQVAPLAVEAEVLVRCGRFVVAVGPSGAQVVAGAAAWPPLAISPRTPIRAAAPDDDSVRVACSDRLVALGELDASGAVRVHRCTEAACETFAWPVEGVGSFDVAVRGNEVWCLSSGGQEVPQVRVARAPFAQAPPVIAACWDSRTGFCGPARFAASGETLLVAAREGSDVLVLAREASAFAGLPGLVSAGHPN